MNVTKILSIIGIIIGISLLSLYFFLLQTKPSDIPNSGNTIIQNTDTEEKVDESVQEKEEEIVPEYILLESGWIPNWAFDLGFESLKQNKEIVSTVNPVLYTINKEGKLESRGIPKSKIQELITYSKANNIRVIPTIGSYNEGSIDALLKDSTNIQRNISDILKEIEIYNFDGIDLDFEIINENSKEKYIGYITLLKTNLSEKNKLLSLTLFAQWNDAKYTDHESTRKVQDYEYLGNIADEVRIMAYDYTRATSKKPGPIGPLDWIEDILEYATSKIPKEKIWLGVHLYSYEWVGTRTEALTNVSVQKLISKENIASTYKKDIGEGYAKFSCVNSTTTCQIYFQTKQGIQDRREIAKRFQIAGISYWRLGGELDLLR